MTHQELLDQIMAYEEGSLDDEETLQLFQELINTGLVWNLQGSYGRTARDLIEAGLCTLPKKEDVCSKTD